MLNKLSTLIIALFTLSMLVFAQSPEATKGAAVRSTLRKIGPTPTPAVTAAPSTQIKEDSPAKPSITTTPRPRRAAQQATTTARNDDAESSSAEGVIAALDALVDGIQRSDVEAVMKLYWSSPQLTIFNNNGTVTRTWDQLHSNRASAYPNAKDVKLDIRNRNVQMIGRDGAVVTCQWAQTQFYRSNPESASGRLTIVFRRIGPAWKIVHTHTSPDAPEPSGLMSSEREAAEDSTPQPKPQQ